MARKGMWVGAVLWVACATNPATGQRQLSLVSESQEMSLGQEASKEVDEQIGLYPDERLAALVDGIARPMAVRSERPKLPWSFKVVDDASPNAFALPGGPVFVTRGLLTYLNSEAELATVLGHEMGHVI